MKYLTPIVFTVLYVAVVALCVKAGPSSRAEASPTVCVSSGPVTMPTTALPPGSMVGTFAGPFEVKMDDSGGVSVVVTAPKDFAAGRYTCAGVKTLNGELVAMTPVDPRAGCVTTVTIDDQGRASFACTKNGCNTACGLNGYLNPDGSTGWKCECNLPPLPGPWPNGPG